jgi:hypothetical protein
MSQMLILVRNLMQMTFLEMLIVMISERNQTGKIFEGNQMPI